MFQLITRTDNSRSSSAFISLRPEHINFSAVFCRMAGIKPAARVKVFADHDNYRLGFLFIDKPDKDSLSLSPQRSDVYVCSVNSIRKIPWVAAVCDLKSKRQRRFTPQLEETENGPIWTVQLCPVFEIRKARESENISAGDCGIYRYVRSNGEIVYIGRGNIRKRLQCHQRLGWDFDVVEYSKIQDSDEQAQWECYWIEQYRIEHLALPFYNRILGQKEQSNANPADTDQANTQH